MSGLPWIKVATDFADHPKALALAHRLDDPRAPLHLPPMWGHFARHYADGSMPDTEDARRTLERGALWSGASGALVAALLDVGLLERRRKRIVVHGWDEWQEAHARKLECDRLRMRANRAKVREEGRATVERGSRDGRAEEETERRGDDLPPTPPRPPPRQRGGPRAARAEADRRRQAVRGALERAGLWLDRDGADEPAVAELVALNPEPGEVERRMRALKDREQRVVRPADLVREWDQLAEAPRLLAGGGV